MKKQIGDKYRKELSKYGIVPEEEINISTRMKICREFTNRIFETFDNFPISYTQIYMRVYNLKIQKAKIDGVKKVFYFYKNNTVYIDEVALKSMSQKMHLYVELIHGIQNFGNRDSRKQRVGLVKFKETKLYGLGLNEGVIQYIVSKMLGNKIKKYTFSSFSIYSISEYYKFLVNLVQQLALLMGDEIISESLFLSDSIFERAFENIYEGEASKIITLLDKIFSISTTHKHSNKELIAIYLKVYKIIISKYLNQMLELITELDEIKTIRLLLQKLNEIAPDGDTFFFEYKVRYGEELKRIQKRIEIEKRNNSLIEVKPNPISRIFKRINDALVNIILE